MLKKEAPLCPKKDPRGVEESAEHISRLCWFKRRRTRMPHWGVCQQVNFSQHAENNPQLSSSIVEEEEENDGVEDVIAESLVKQENQKRKCPGLGQLHEVNVTRRGKQRQSSTYGKGKKLNKIESAKFRWSEERYNHAEQSMLEILKAEGAVFGNPISRPALRTAARKHIGDTGLLDHLLKHIDGKVAPGGTERFRRWHSTNGVMEYWLESADLVDIRQEARVQDPYWVPPTRWMPSGGSSQDLVSAGELKLLKEEMTKMRRDMLELVSKKQGLDQANMMEEMHKEWVKWKAKTEQRLMEMSSSLSGMQGMYRELVMWKAKIEQQLMEISNTLSSMQVPKQCTTFSPLASERWEDWLESTNLDNIQVDDLAPWLDNTDVVNAGREGTVQDPYLALPPRSNLGDSPSQDLICARELELLKEEMAKMKRDVQELVPKKPEEDQANVTPDSSATANSNLDLDNSLLFSQVIKQQEMFEELARWKAKMEQQLLQISNSVSSMLTSKK